MHMIKLWNKKLADFTMGEMIMAGVFFGGVSILVGLAGMKATFWLIDRETKKDIAEMNSSLENQEDTSESHT